MIPPVVFDPGYELDWPAHVFPTDKYRRAAEALVEAGDVAPDGFHAAGEPVDRASLALVHDAAYLDLLHGIAAGELPWDPRMEVPVSESVLRSFRLATAGSIVAARLALDHGAAVNLGGGFHHAYPDHGEGFCLLHDAAVAVEVLRAEGRLRRALFVDLDVHQGNGTVACFRDDPDTFTLSLHQENNYPWPKERGSLDVGLADGTADDAYVVALQDALAVTAQRFPRPDLLVYVAGADAFVEDKLGGLALTHEGFRRRDEAVADFARQQGCPVLGVLAGGYARDTRDVVAIHVNLVRRLGPLLH